MSIDNPSYFYNDDESMPRTPDSPNRRFFFFRRRSSSSNKLLTSPKIKDQAVSANLELPPNCGRDGGHHKGTLRSLLRSKSQNNSPCIYSQILPKNEAANLIRSSNHISEDTIEYRFRERLTSCNESLSYNESDEVFPRNNHSLPRPPSNGYPLNDSSGARRHSIGTFGRRDRLRSTSFSDEVPKMPAPKAPAVSPARKHGKSMDDILVITTKQSEHGTIWFNHLKTCFDNITKQRGRVPFNFLHIKINDGPISSELSLRSKQTKLQIVIICPVMISMPSAFLKSQLSEIIKPSVALGMFLDVSEEKLLEIHKSAFPSFYNWKRVIVKSTDQSPLSELVGTAIDILGKALRELPLCSEVTTSVISMKGHHHDHFTVFPRKVRAGQNKVLAMMTEPLAADDVLKVKIEKMGEILEVPHVKKRNPYTLQLAVPDCCLEVSSMIGIRIEKNGTDIGCKPVKCESKMREMEQILKTLDSPVKFMCQSLGLDATADIDKLDLYLVQSFQKNVPPNFDLLSTVQEKSNFFMFKDSRPEEYPTLLHFAAKYGFERLCLQLVEFPGGVTACDLKNCTGKTPEEIAEEEKHHKISSYLKYFSQMHRITTMYDYVAGINDDKEADGKTEKTDKTVDIEKKPNNMEPVENGNVTQPEYMQMSGSNSSSGTDTPDSPHCNGLPNLNYIKVETNSSDSDTQELTNELKITEPSYYDSNEINVKSDQFSQECSNVLENFSSDYMVQPSNIPITSPLLPKKLNIPNGFSDYLTHPSNIPVESFTPTFSRQQSLEMGDYVIQPSNRKVETFEDHQHMDEPTHINITPKKKKSSTLRRQGSDISKSSVDDELLEIINDFKNNVFTIQEVEQLVASWKNRNDVQQSFKDKQDQLQKMREEYDRIQHKMKEKLKRPTPLERMKRMFSRGKSIHNQQPKENSIPTVQIVECHGNASNNNIDEPSGNTKPAYRPMSSLSLHSVSSSSSSGRLSTGSACSGASLGDSGTHSDHDDRRFSSSTCRIGQPGSLMDNYMIPPTPRPIQTPVSTPTPVEEKERLVFPNRSNPTSPSEHYILFPSNIPVFPSSSSHDHQNSSHLLHHDYMNFSGLNTIVETPFELPHQASSSTAAANEVCITLQPIKIPKKDNYVFPKITENLCSSFKSSNIANNNNLNENHCFDKENFDRMKKFEIGKC